MTIILADKNIEGQAVLLMGTFNVAGWSELFSVRLLTFEEAGLPPDTSDRMLWKFVQDNNIICYCLPITGI
ncbi:hypothetical protein QUF80_19475 [Desulfococcaceae bacterium HSG8]|nr:hypothetical protein [Desulfococcaceae bacterium HSG8]